MCQGVEVDTVHWESRMGQHKNWAFLGRNQCPGAFAVLLRGMSILPLGVCLNTGMGDGGGKRVNLRWLVAESLCLLFVDGSSLLDISNGERYCISRCFFRCQAGSTHYRIALVHFVVIQCVARSCLLRRAARGQRHARSPLTMFYTRLVPFTWNIIFNTPAVCTVRYLWVV